MSKKNLKFTHTMWMNMNFIETLVQRRTAKESLTISKLFDQSFAINVPESRYLPVEASSDLLLLQSDLYTCTDGVVTRNTAKGNLADPKIELGPEFETINDFQTRFKSIPSNVELVSLKVIGDVCFGTGITLKGKVDIQARPGMKIVIPNYTVLENKIITSQGDVRGGSL